MGRARKGRRTPAQRSQDDLISGFQKHLNDAIWKRREEELKEGRSCQKKTS